MTMHASCSSRSSRRSGFTLPEVMVSLSISLLVFAGIFAAFLLNRNGWMMATATVQSSSAASMALERIVYGMGGLSLRAQQAADMELLPDLDDEGSWLLRYENGTRWLGYDAVSGLLVNEGGRVLCRDLQACEVDLQDGGLWIDLTVEQPGRFLVSTSRMRSFVRFRN